MSVAPVATYIRVAAPTPNTATTSRVQSPVEPASPHRNRDQLLLGDGWTITPSTHRGTQRQNPQPRQRPVPPLPDDFARRHCFQTGSADFAAASDGGSACSAPSRDCDRTRFVPCRCSNTNLPAARSPLGHDDQPPLQTLRS